ncbi:PIN domain-containing protein [Candidatus Pacearchaeota archaeon]|nr:PIN domain-containing protein [Candidatus Pacearchaeota archaeon]
MADYFFDSYAIVELLQGNPNYAKYINEPIVITLFNLVEIYWVALREYGEKKANEIYEVYRPSIIDISDEVIKKAIKFREKHKKRDLSYADSIGYIYAIENNLIFLTGDKEFENMKKVEFVK